MSVQLSLMSFKREDTLLSSENQRVSSTTSVVSILCLTANYENNSNMFSFLYPDK